MRKLDPSAEMKMDRVRDQLRDQDEKKIKGRLKSVEYKVDYSVLAAVTAVVANGLKRYRDFVDLTRNPTCKTDFLTSCFLAYLSTLVVYEQAECVLRDC